jgi:hypothetical protein
MVYIELTKRTIEIRLKEDLRNIKYIKMKERE